MKNILSLLSLLLILLTSCTYDEISEPDNANRYVDDILFIQADESALELSYVVSFNNQILVDTTTLNTSTHRIVNADLISSIKIKVLETTNVKIKLNSYNKILTLNKNNCYTFNFNNDINNNIIIQNILPISCN